MAANADNQLGDIRPFQKKDGSNDIHDGSKCYEFDDWRREHLNSGGKIVVAGFSHKVSLLGRDRGNINGTAFIGNAGDPARIKDEADFVLRGQASCARLCANLAPECGCRRFIEETPELAASGYFALLYLISECYLARPRTELDEKWRSFSNLQMEEVFDIRKFTPNSMKDWHQYCRNYWMSHLTAGQRADKGEQELCIKIIHGCTSKFPDKRELTDEPCSLQNLVYQANHAARVFAAGPPPVFPSPARTQGEFRLDELCAYMDRRWRAAVKAGQIHVVAVREEKVQYVKKKEGGFSRSSKKPSKPSKSSSSSSASGSREKVEPQNLRCYNCGGIGHVATVCGTEKGLLTRSLLMKIHYPSETSGKWPASWSDKNVRRVGDDDEFDQDSDDGARPDDEEQHADDAEESDDSDDDTQQSEQVKYVRDGPNVRYIVDGSTDSTFSRVKTKVLRIIRPK